ncbi:SLBB domain-containing protein [Gammaproteobacteria bacterium]|nr:SLBB domain-containing protein [Gammaproteobacteria bacterium]
MKKAIILSAIILLSPVVYSQDVGDLSSLDKNFLESLPDSVRDDVMAEMDIKEQGDKNLQRRPSSEISKLDTVKNWENFKKQQSLIDKSERYGLTLFHSMQSSFMPLNEPNFGNNYIVDYGDYINIELFGTEADSYNIEVKRDGTVTLDKIGAIRVAGLNFEQVTALIKNKYATAFIGVEAIVNLSAIRDINILVTGNVNFPGMYTLSGNSNILQALNMVGGISEEGTLRNIKLQRANKETQKIDLYKALLFGDIESIPFLQSGDSIHIGPAFNLVRAGYGFNKEAVFELTEDETIKDLVNYAGGLKNESKNDALTMVRYDNNKFISYEIESNKFSSYKTQHLDSIYADKEQIGTISITGDVKHPGKYSISSSDRVLDIIKRSGGYTDSSYPFGGTLFRESVKKLENVFVAKSYQNLISFIATSPSAIGGQAQGLGLVLSELKNYKPLGRVIAEFNELNLEENLQDNIYLKDGDEIFIPSYQSNIFIFGEVGNPGSVSFKEDDNIQSYIERSGGLTRYSSQDSIFIVSPNGETKKIYLNGLKKYLSQDIDVYPGSVIYVPRHVGKIEGINYYATIAPIFSSLALSIASLNSIK